MKIRLLFLFSFFSFFISAQHVRKLGNVAAITFPGEPTQFDTTAANIYTYNDGAFVYSAGIEYPQGKIQGITLDSLYATYAYNFTEAGIAKLVSKNKIKLDSYDAIEIEFKYERETFNTGILRVIYLDSKFYFCFVITTESFVGDDAPRFFDSFTIGSGKFSQMIPRKENVGFKQLGSSLGKLIIPAVIILVVIVGLAIWRGRQSNSTG